MFYGLHFTSDAGQVCQIAVNTANGRIYQRSTVNGAWQSWRRVDVDRNRDGTLAEEVAEATHAKRADVAGRLASPMKITFTGGVSGEVSFDGSGNASCSLSIPALGNIQDRLAQLEKSKPDTDHGWNY